MVFDKNRTKFIPVYCKKHKKSIKKHLCTKRKRKPLSLTFTENITRVCLEEENSGTSNKEENFIVSIPISLKSIEKVSLPMKKDKFLVTKLNKARKRKRSELIENTDIISNQSRVFKSSSFVESPVILKAMTMKKSCLVTEQLEDQDEVIILDHFPVEDFPEKEGGIEKELAKLSIQPTESEINISELIISFKDDIFVEVFDKLLIERYKEHGRDKLQSITFS